MALPAEKPLPRSYTPEEYLELERRAEYKSEYIDGHIYAMAGATPTHAAITANVIMALGNGVTSGRCRVFSGDLKIASDLKGHYTYADAVVVCGTPRYHDKFNDVLLNPSLIVEVLSPATEAYDRGEKFKRYRRIASLTDYLLISQDQPLIEHFSKQASGWTMTDADSLKKKLKLKTLKCLLSLADIYRGITFSEGEQSSPLSRQRPARKS